MVNKTMKTLTIGEVTYEIVDEVARNDIGSKASESDLSAHIADTNNPHKTTIDQFGITATVDELNYVSGVTSNVQTQFDAISGLVGDTSVSEQITAAIDNINNIIAVDENNDGNVVLKRYNPDGSEGGGGGVIETNSVVDQMSTSIDGDFPIILRGIEAGEEDITDVVSFNTGVTVNPAEASVNAQKYQLDGLDITRAFEPTVPFGESIPENTDLNDIKYLAIGNYFCSSGAISATLTNNPTEYAFLLTVLSPISKGIDNENDTWRYRVRKILDHTGHQYIQHCHTEGTAGEWIFSEWEQILTSGSALPLTGGELTGNLTVKGTTENTWVRVTNNYNTLYLESAKSGTRGLWDATKNAWIVSADSSNNVTLNGNAATATTATKLASGALSIMHIADWSGEIAANGYTSRIDIAVPARSGYIFLDCTGYSSSSSYVCPYGMFSSTANQISVYFRNINSSKAITPSMSFWGLYQKI